MKIRKILLSMLTVVATGAIVATTVTACGVSQDIIDNIVSRGDGSKFSNNVSFEQTIKTALTNKDATDAFKKSVVNKLFFNWFNGISDSNIDILKKQYQKDIDSDWDSQVQSYKDNHSANWQYYFQNEVLNPVGGVKGKTDGTTDNSWYQSKWEDKIRSYFTDEMIKHDYLAVPLADQTLINTQNPTFNFPKTNLDLKVATSIDAQGVNLGSTDFMNEQQNLLNPDWWPAINFYATANPNYSPDNSIYQDKSYALLQRQAFDSYTSTAAPISTGMVLWNYSLGTLSNLESIYNKDVVKGKNDTAGLLDAPGYSFPYFGGNGTSSFDKNQMFKQFADDFKSSNYFFNNRDDVNLDDTGQAAYNFTTQTVNKGSVGLINIPLNQYGDDTSDVFLVEQSTGITGAFQTYAGPVFDLYHNKNSVVKAGALPIMPALIGSDQLFASDDNILDNFLFAPDDTSTPNVLKQLPYDTTKFNGIVNLEDTFGKNADGHINLFNKDSDFYKDDAHFMINAVRLVTASSDSVTGNDVYLPYIMIRNDKGVHIEGIDGAGYLAQDNGVPTAVSSTWRPGAPWSQERENQILKYRTIYESEATTPISGTGIGLISQKGGAASAEGKIIDYLKANIDSLVLSAVDVVLDPTNPNYDSSYKTANMFGLSKFNSNDDWNTQLNALVQSFDILNLFQTVITNYDANNKHLLEWSDKYIANSLYNPTADDVFLKYDNGLAMQLPLEVKSGKATGMSDGKFKNDAKTYFQVASDCNDSVWDSINLWFNPDYSPVNRWDKSLSDYTNDIATKYDTWVTSISNNSKPSKEGKGNLGGEYNNGKYSENILSFNPHVNALLNAFGASSSFSNSEKTYALSQYLNGYSPGTVFDNPITSLFITQQLLKSSSISSLLTTNSTGNALPTFSDYKSALTSQWAYQLSMTIGSSAIGTNVSRGYTDQLINYDMLLASMKWLSENNYSNFMDEMRQKIIAPSFASSSWQNAYIVWMTKDSSYGNHEYETGDWGQDPNTPTTYNVDNDENASKWYAWRNNYDNIFSQEYSQTSGTTISAPIDTSYQSFAEYNQFAPMPTMKAQTGDVHSFDAMGYLGLQTSSTVSSVIKDALENRFPSSSTMDPTNNGANKLRGSLYNFASLNPNGTSNYDNSRTNLCNIVDRLGTDSSGLINLATYLNTRTGQFDAVINKMNNASTSADRAKILKDAIKGSTSIIKDVWFDGYNIIQAKKGTTAAAYSYTPTLELRNPSQQDTPVIKDSSAASEEPAGYRTRVMQLNANNLATIDTLKATVGDDLFNYLVVQVALDSQTPGTSVYRKTLKAVMTAAYGTDGQTKVYDRRFNDQLGSTWVKDWKSKN